MPRKKNRRTKFYIGTKTTALASETAWTEIEGIQTIGGSIGLQFAAINATALTDSINQEVKGLPDAGDIDLTFMLETTAASATTPHYAAGQKLLKDACDDESDAAYNFKIDLDDNPDTAGDGTPTRFTFQGHVMNFRANFGGNNTMVTGRSQIQLTTAVTFAAANDGA